MVVGNLGLQYNMNAAYASSIVSSDTSREGTERSAGTKPGAICFGWLVGERAEKRGEALEGVEGVCELRDISP